MRRRRGHARDRRAARLPRGDRLGRRPGADHDRQADPRRGRARRRQRRRRRRAAARRARERPRRRRDAAPDRGRRSAPTCPGRCGPAACSPPAPASTSSGSTRPRPTASSSLPSREQLSTPRGLRARPTGSGCRATARALRGGARGACGGERPPVVNDLQDAARSLCPSIDEALDAARGAGARDAIVAGSGPTVLGFFDTPADAERRRRGSSRARDPRPDRREAGVTRVIAPARRSPSCSLVVSFRNRRRAAARARSSPRSSSVAAARRSTAPASSTCPNVEELLLDIGETFGNWSYLLVGGLAFLETGAFVGLVAPGETAVIAGGVFAGQGNLELVVLLLLVWAACVAGDSAVVLARAQARPRVPRRARPAGEDHRGRASAQVEDFFDRRGGITILIGRFIGHRPARSRRSSRAPRRCRTRASSRTTSSAAGLWAATFVLLGYFSWRNIDRAAEIASRGTLALGTDRRRSRSSALLAYKFLRTPEQRAAGAALAAGSPRHASECAAVSNDAITYLVAGLLRGVRARGLRGVDPRARLDGLQPLVGAGGGGVPDAVRPRRDGRPRAARRRRRRLVLGPHHRTDGRPALPFGRVHAPTRDGGGARSRDARRHHRGRRVRRGTARGRPRAAARPSTRASSSSTAPARCSRSRRARPPTSGRSWTADDVDVARAARGRPARRAGCGCAAAARPAGPALLRLVTTLVASEVERVRAPEQASREAVAAFLHGVARARLPVARGPGRPRAASSASSWTTARASSSPAPTPT